MEIAYLINTPFTNISGRNAIYIWQLTKTLVQCFLLKFLFKTVHLVDGEFDPNSSTENSNLQSKQEHKIQGQEIQLRNTAKYEKPNASKSNQQSMQ